MVHLESASDDDDEQQTVNSSAAAAPASATSASSGFQQLLQLASHIKSSQPEVRQQRARWERLRFWQMNSIRWQQDDAAARYDGVLASGAEAATATAMHAAAAADHVLPGFDARYDSSLALKSEAGALYGSREWSRASALYQRAIGRWQWARKWSGKAGDDIEWNDLLRTAGDSEDTIQQPPVPPDAIAHPTLEQAAGQSTPLAVRFALLTPPQLDRALRLVHACLVNVAACEEKEGAWTHVVDACQSALDLGERIQRLQQQPRSSEESGETKADPLTQLTVKALYRGAMAYNKLEQLDKAVRAAEEEKRRRKARWPIVRSRQLTVVPLLSALFQMSWLDRAVQLSPNDSLLTRTLASFRREARAQAAKDRAAFGGFFERPGAQEDVEEILRAREASEAAAAALASSAAAQASPAKPARSERVVPSSSDFESLKDARTRSFLVQYWHSFQSAQRQQQRQTRAHDTPSDTQLALLLADARLKFELDLTDPLVQEELLRLQRTGGKDEPETGESNDASDRRSAATAQQRAKGSKSSGQELPSDLAAGGSWIGPLLFVLVLAVALRWMHIL